MIIKKMLHKRTELRCGTSVITTFRSKYKGNGEQFFNFAYLKVSRF